MQLSILGSGGPLPIPRPGCHCRVCLDARREAGRSWRSGPCIFVHDVNLLVDATEVVTPLLAHAGIESVKHLFITHWHPDHTAGFRVVEQVNFDIATGGARSRTNVWMNTATADRLVADWRYFEARGYCRLHVVDGGAPIDLGAVSASWFNYEANGFVSGFVLTDGNVRVLLALDETKGLAARVAAEPSFQECDLLVAECGWFESDPDGRVLVSPGSPMRKREAGFERDTLPLIVAARAKRTVLTHLMDLHGRTPAELDALAATLSPPNVQFAYDGLTLRI